MVDIGESGRQSDGGVFARSTLGKGIKNKLFDIPNAETLNNISMPYVFFGDDAFPMGVNLMKPYPRHNLDDPKN